VAEDAEHETVVKNAAISSGNSGNASKFETDNIESSTHVDKNGKKSYQCKVCNLTFKGIHSCKRYKCEQCDYMTGKKSLLIEHKAVKH